MYCILWNMREAHVPQNTIHCLCGEAAREGEGSKNRTRPEAIVHSIMQPQHNFQGRPIEECVSSFHNEVVSYHGGRHPAWGAGIPMYRGTTPCGYHGPRCHEASIIQMKNVITILSGYPLCLQAR